MLLDNVVSWLLISLVTVATLTLGAAVARLVFPELRPLRLDRSESSALVQALVIVGAALLALTFVVFALRSFAAGL